MSWISVKDKLPDSTIVVDIWIGDSALGDRIPSAMFDYMEKVFYCPDTDCTYDGVTHWMPFPDPPVED